MLLPFRRTYGLLMVGLLALAACKNESQPGPEAGTDYYPLALGDYRIFDVVDSVWVSTQLQPVSHYQFRERLAEVITDASGQPAYRVVRSRRTLPTDTWRDDSVFVLNATASTVELTRNNRRTVELVFPVREGRLWNRDAYNGRDERSETGQPESRQYLSVDQPFDVRANDQQFHYEHTLTTDDIEDVLFDNPCTSTAKYRQVYAKGSGPVARVRRLLYHDIGGDCDPTINVRGQVRRETLLEKGNTP